MLQSLYRFDPVLALAPRRWTEDPLSSSLVDVSAVLSRERPGQNFVGRYHSEVLIAPNTLHGLVGHLGGSGVHMHPLFGPTAWTFDREHNVLVVLCHLKVTLGSGAKSSGISSLIE